mmetsp:Transcript_1175/g.3018  ORF Transcript_1175/g.3018 Transcript_1175/m.3018 type:complete len:508 (+) Transcript_1175:1-1524(+)
MEESAEHDAVRPSDTAEKALGECPSEPERKSLPEAAGNQSDAPDPSSPADDGAMAADNETVEAAHETTPTDDGSEEEKLSEITKGNGADAADGFRSCSNTTVADAAALDSKGLQHSSRPDAVADADDSDGVAAAVREVQAELASTLIQTVIVEPDEASSARAADDKAADADACVVSAQISDARAKGRTDDAPAASGDPPLGDSKAEPAVVGKEADAQTPCAASEPSATASEQLDASIFDGVALYRGARARGGTWKRHGSHSSVSSLATLESSDAEDELARSNGLPPISLLRPVGGDTPLCPPQQESAPLLDPASRRDVGSHDVLICEDEVNNEADPAALKTSNAAEGAPDEQVKRGSIADDAAAAETLHDEQSPTVKAQPNTSVAGTTLPIAPSSSGISTASRPELRRALMAYGTVLLDVRSEAERASSPLPIPSISCPLNLYAPCCQELLAQAPKVLPRKNTPVVAFCDSGARAAVALSALEAEGYQKLLNGGGADNVLACLMAGM